MKFYGGVRAGKTNRVSELILGGDPDHHADCPIGDHYSTNYEWILMKLSG